MGIDNINGIYQSKLNEIKDKMPKISNVDDKFKTLLEQAKLAKSDEAPKETLSKETEEKNDDTNKLLTQYLASKSALSSSTLFNDSSSSNMFSMSSLNNSMQMMQQNALIKALTNSTAKDEEK